jgi:hypothetical protein
LQAVGDTTATLALNSAATTVGTVEAVDDYYNNAVLLDTTNMKYWTISDYVGSTGVATVNWTAGTKPTGTPTYEIMPLIDCEKFQALLKWELANYILAVDRDKMPLYPANHPYKQAKRRFDDYWQHLQRRMSESFRRVDGEYE